MVIDPKLQLASCRWQATVIGYLSSPQVYDSLYELLRKHGDYQKALYTNFENRDTRKRLVKHFCVGYLWRKENLKDEDSLFRQCIDIWKSDDILKMIPFFWAQKISYWQSPYRQRRIRKNNRYTTRKNSKFLGIHLW